MIERLYNNGIILFGDFRLSSGISSPYYIDLRRIYSISPLFKDVIKLYMDKLRLIEHFDVISGIATGSIPLASVLAYLLEKPMIYVRKNRKNFGIGRVVEGFLREGEDAVVIEDVVTTGSSILDAVNAIRGLGGRVEYALAFVDRLQGASQNLHEYNVKLISIYKVTDMLDYLFRRSFIDKEKYLQVLEYIKR